VNTYNIPLELFEPKKPVKVKIEDEVFHVPAEEANLVHEMLG
jgi:hypothetical protein